MTHNISDSELINRCLSGEDRESWEIFTRRYSKLVWNAVHKTFISNSFSYTKEDVEDMFSTLFLALTDNDFRKLRQFRGDNSCSVSTWLSVITVRMTIDYMRKNKRRFDEVTGTEDRDIWELIPVSKKNRADKLIEEWQADASIKQSVETLSPQDKMIYDLMFNRGFAPEDIAKTLGISVSAVYSRKHRVINKIKKNIGGV